MERLLVVVLAHLNLYHPGPTRPEILSDHNIVLTMAVHPLSLFSHKVGLYSSARWASSLVYDLIFADKIGVDGDAALPWPLYVYLVTVHGWLSPGVRMAIV